MEQNDIISKQLLHRINKIEKLESRLRKEKELARDEIKKQISKKTFSEMTSQISESGYAEEQVVVQGREKKELDKQKIEYDDYVTVLKMYNTISINKSNRQ